VYPQTQLPASYGVAKIRSDTLSITSSGSDAEKRIRETTLDAKLVGPTNGDIMQREDLMQPWLGAWLGHFCTCEETTETVVGALGNYYLRALREGSRKIKGGGEEGNHPVEHTSTMNNQIQSCSPAHGRKKERDANKRVSIMVVLNSRLEESIGINGPLTIVKKCENKK